MSQRVWKLTQESEKILRKEKLYKPHAELCALCTQVVLEAHYAEQTVYRAHNEVWGNKFTINVGNENTKPLICLQ